MDQCASWTLSGRLLSRIPDSPVSQAAGKTGPEGHHGGLFPWPINLFSRQPFPLLVHRVSPHESPLWPCELLYPQTLRNPAFRCAGKHACIRRADRGCRHRGTTVSLFSTPKRDGPGDTLRVVLREFLVCKFLSRFDLAQLYLHGVTAVMFGLGNIVGLFPRARFG